MPSRTLVHAAVGGLVSIVLSFTGASPLLGGAVAGYLEREDGLRVGALAGVIAAAPMVLLFFLFGAFVFGAADAAGVGALFFALLLFVVAYTVGLSAAGGLVGVWVFEEYGDELPTL